MLTAKSIKIDEPRIGYLTNIASFTTDTSKHPKSIKLRKPIPANLHDVPSKLEQLLQLHAPPSNSDTRKRHKSSIHRGSDTSRTNRAVSRFIRNRLVNPRNCYRALYVDAGSTWSTIRWRVVSC